MIIVKLLLNLVLFVFVVFVFLLTLAEKNDHIDMTVTQVHEDFIRGVVGPAEVLIPTCKMT